MPDFNPKIVAFVCNWCSYAGADKAGEQKLDYSAKIKLIRVMCSGRVDPQFVMDAFRKGADGVMILGCHPESCQYLTGSSRAERRAARIRALLEQAGFDASRVSFGGIASVEPGRFLELVK